jgi:hypothetical protein
MPLELKEKANNLGESYKESPETNKPTVDEGDPLSLDEIGNNFTQSTFQDVNMVGASAPTPFSAPDLDRYLSYGTETYGKLGYNPFVGAAGRDETYNANTSASTDVTRAWTGMWKLAGVGFQDTFAFGAFADAERHKDFENIMSTYSSSRGGGGTQFFSNTMLSSGYTIGIMAAIAAEELGIGLLTGGLGYLGTGAQAIRAAKAIDKAGDVIKTVNKAKDINLARTLKTGGKRILESLNPVGETADFIRNADKLNDFNNWQKSLQGAASVARDARKIYNICVIGIKKILVKK